MNLLSRWPSGGSQRFFQSIRFAAGEAQREVGGSKTMVHRQWHLRRTGEQDAGWRQKAVKFQQGSFLGWSVEVDEEIAAENKIIRFRLRQTVMVENVPPLKPHEVAG